MSVTRQGSTKTLRASQYPGYLNMNIGPHLSAFDVGACPHAFPSIAAARRDFAAQVFADLKYAGILTHFVNSIGETGMLVEEYQSFELVGGEMVPRELLSGCSNGTVIPLEFLLRYRVATSGMVERIKNDNALRSRMSIPADVEPYVGMELVVPFVECSTKLEEKDRYLEDSEAMEIGDLSPVELDACKQLMQRIGAVICRRAEAAGLSVWDLKGELAKRGDEFVLVDGITQDEIRIKDEEGRSQDKDPFRNWLESVGFKAAVEHARKHGQPLPPYPMIPPKVSREISEGYCSVTDKFCGN